MMSTTAQTDLIATPNRRAVLTCLGCGSISRSGTCVAGCREQRIEIVPAGAYDELTAARSRTRACVDAFQEVAEGFVTRQPTVAQYESAYRSVREQAGAALHRFPERPEDVLDEAPEPTTAWWCAECGGVDRPKPCLEFCIWRLVDWVSADSYQREREGVLSDRFREACLRRLLRRVASVTPREGQWETCWQSLQAEARRTLEASDEVASTAPAAARTRSQAAVGSRRDTIHGSEDEEYQRGREHGIAWACNFATADELQDFVESSHVNRRADFDADHALCDFFPSQEDADVVGVSHYDNPRWRGFVAGAEEVLDASGHRPPAVAARPATTAGPPAPAKP